jgi:predicted ABC-type ATPase
LFAGPNASGKTYVFKKIRKSNLIPKEIYVNADKIEAELMKKKKFYFNSYRVRTDEEEFRSHILRSGLFREKIHDENFQRDKPALRQQTHRPWRPPNPL